MLRVQIVNYARALFLILVSFSLIATPVNSKKITKSGLVKNITTRTSTVTAVAPIAPKKNLTASVKPPTACASLTVACSTAPTAPAAQQCCANLVCDPHDYFCHTANGMGCALSSSTCAYGSICSTLGSANNQATCQLCNSTAANNNSCVVNSDCCQPDNSSVTKSQSCQSGSCANCLVAKGVCGDSSICCTGFVCLGDLGHKTCTACLSATATEQCTTTEECCDGLSCQAGKCTSCAEVSGSCVTNASCCGDLNQLFCNSSNQCVNCIANGTAISCAESSQCCQAAESQICLNSQCEVCSQFCNVCNSATPCCDGYTCIDSSDFGNPDAALSCTGANCYCCATDGMPCNSAKTIVDGSANLCTTYNLPTTTGCCPGKVCNSLTNLCQNCIVNGGTCLHNSDCCTTDNLVCLADSNNNYKTCQTVELCAALNGTYNAGITNIYQNIASYLPLSLSVTAPGPCTAAFWSYLYHVNVLALYNWAISETYADMPCHTGVIQQLKVKMENSLRVMEAVCYDNSAVAVSGSAIPTVPQPQCGMTPNGSTGMCGNGVTGPTAGQSMPAYLATLPQCMNVTQLLYNFVLAKACSNTTWQTPAIQRAFFTAWAAGGNSFTVPLNYGQLIETSAPDFPVISNLPNSVAPAIFSAQDVQDLLVVGCYPSSTLCSNAVLVSLDNIPSFNQNVTNNPKLKKLANSNNQVEIIQFISNVIDRTGVTMDATLFYSNWLNPNTLLPTACTCWDRNPASYIPSIQNCTCADTTTCLCDPQPDGDGGSVTLPFKIVSYADGSGCEGACWDGPCSCTTPDTTCTALFGGTPQCNANPKSQCVCNDKEPCSCNGDSSSSVVDYASGKCLTLTGGCSAKSRYFVGEFWLPLDAACTMVADSSDVSGRYNTCKKLAAEAYQCAIVNYDCTCCSNSSVASTKDCCTNAQSNYAKLIPDYDITKYGNLTFSPKKQTDCVCSDQKSSCIQPAITTCTETPAPIPACQTAQYGCCYDGSQNGSDVLTNPDCIKNFCCLDTVNLAIANNAQIIADNLNAILFLIEPSGVIVEQVPQDWQGVPCAIPNWIETVETDLMIDCIGALQCVNPSECAINTSCTVDTDCPNCYCDTTTHLCVSCVPLGHGCLGVSGASECCGGQYANCSQGICVNS